MPYGPRLWFAMGAAALSLAAIAILSETVLAQGPGGASASRPAGADGRSAPIIDRQVLRRAAVALAGETFSANRAVGLTTIRSAAGVRPATIVYRPANLSRAVQVPLVIGLHASGGSPTLMEQNTNFDRVATEHGFVMAYLGAATSPPWNAPDDLSYISSQIDQVKASENIDPSRVYVAGFSAGGRMTYSVGCHLSADIAAIAVISSVMRGYTCAISHPVSELTIIGGNESLLVNGRRPDFPSAATVASRWRALDGCPAQQPQTSQVGPVTQRIWDSCVNGSTVGLYVVQAGHHAWPGQLGQTGPDAPGMYDATEAAWAFVSTHRATPGTFGGYPRQTTGSGFGTGSSPGKVKASLTRLRFHRTAGGRRLLRVTARIRETVSVKVRLSRSGRTFASRNVRLHVGNRTFSVTVPSGSAAGRARVTVVFTDRAGATRSARRTLDVPRRSA